MNSYFASVEQQANPHLRGKPVGVCAYMGRNGAIIASSIEAKARGVKIMRAFEARRFCPEIVLVQNDPAKYRSTTERIFSILADYSDSIEPYSIDEAFVNLTGFTKTYDEALRIGLEIKGRIKSEVGEWLRSSVGIAPTKFLAKLRSDNAEKDSIGMLDRTNIDSFIQSLKLTDICGINVRMEARLRAIGIDTPLQLKYADPERLLISMGKYGYYLWSNLNGKPIEAVRSVEQPKSIGHSYCLPRKTTDREWLAGVFMKLCEKTGRRLRAQQREAHSIAVSVGFVDAPGFHTHRTLSTPLFTTREIFDTAWHLLSTHLINRVNFLAVSVGSLTELSDQLSLFGAGLLQHSSAGRPVQQAMDAVNDRFGDFTVYFGMMMGKENSVPDRIGFRKTLPAVFVPHDEIVYNQSV